MNSYTSSTLQRLGLLDRNTGLIPRSSELEGPLVGVLPSLSAWGVLQEGGAGEVGEKASS